jgi:hypothetical protein
MKKFSAGIILFLVCSGFLLGNANLVLAQTPPSTGTNAAQATADYDYKLGTCSFSPFSDGGSFVSCLEWAFYGLILYPSGLFADLTGNLFDVFVAYSISSDSYTNANGQFINQGWGVIRDIANVMFIFILLYIAIRHILQMGSSNTKRLLTSLIIAALLINFSLFFSKVIIDAGNIFSQTIL